MDPCYFVIHFLGSISWTAISWFWKKRRQNKIKNRKIFAFFFTHTISYDQTWWINISARDKIEYVGMYLLRYRKIHISFMPTVKLFGLLSYERNRATFIINPPVDPTLHWSSIYAFRQPLDLQQPRHSGYSFVLTCYYLSLALCLRR